MSSVFVTLAERLVQDVPTYVYTESDPTHWAVVEPGCYPPSAPCVKYVARRLDLVNPRGEKRVLFLHHSVTALLDQRAKEWQEAVNIADSQLSRARHELAAARNAYRSLYELHDHRRLRPLWQRLVAAWRNE